MFSCRNFACVCLCVRGCVYVCACVCVCMCVYVPVHNVSVGTARRREFTNGGTSKVFASLLGTLKSGMGSFHFAKGLVCDAG